MIRGERILCDMAGCEQLAVEVLIIGGSSWDCCREHFTGAVAAMTTDPRVNAALDVLLGQLGQLRGDTDA